MELLEKIEFDPKRDRLWIAGDLVNRGEGSLETLEYLYSIRESLVIVVGNHDITLIAAWLGLRKSNPTIDPILQSPQAEKLIDWLRLQKFMYIDDKLGYCMTHAGISPEFDLETASRYAKRIEGKLHSEGYEKWLSLMFEKGVSHFGAAVTDIEKDRYILSSFIRMRYCYSDARLEFKQKGPPDPKNLEQKSLNPWFNCPTRKKIDLKILFGHWSTLGFYNDNKVCCLDSGCVWNGSLTAMRIDGEEEEVVQVKCNRKIT
jgi:bis(5'-nucleosyl)-tetraphosphatase (symmetrical)